MLFQGGDILAESFKAHRLCHRQYTDLQRVIDFIDAAIERLSGRHHGYRWMYGKCQGRGLMV